MISTARILVLIALALLQPACGPDGSEPLASDLALEIGNRYVQDAAFRRSVLEGSLVSRTNTYALLRLASYDEAHWGALEEWNPRVRPVMDQDIGRFVGADLPVPDETFESLAEKDIGFEDEQALLALGEQAFFRYPVQLAPYLRTALLSEENIHDYGLWRDQGRVGGAVWVELPRDGMQTALTCSSCHAVRRGGRLVTGLNNDRLDLGRLMGDGGGDPARSRWGRGRIDVTGDNADNPTAITDLRAVRSQVHLHRAGTLHNHLAALAVRLETLVITSHGQAVRPPRRIAFALALYLWRLQSEPVRRPDDRSARGEAIFSQQCARCHQTPDYSGPAVALHIVGTDPAVGQSPERTTGSYRVPSLRGIGDRRLLFAAGQVQDLEELLDPERAAKGHRFGLDLSPGDRADLQAFLETL